MAYAGIYDLGKHLGIQTEFKMNDTNKKKVVTNLYVNNIYHTVSYELLHIYFIKWVYILRCIVRQIRRNERLIVVLFEKKIFY